MLAGMLAGAVALGVGLSACNGSNGDTPAPLDDGGSQGDTNKPPLDGLTALAITPSSGSIAVPVGGVGKQPLTITGTFTDGSSRDVTNDVTLSVVSGPATIASATVSATSGGEIDVQAASGTISAKAVFDAKLSGDVVIAPADPSIKTALSGSGGSVGDVVYPLDGALFPSNLGTLDVQVASTTGEVARVDVSGKYVDLHFFGACESVGGGCSIKLDATAMIALVTTSAMPNGDSLPLSLGVRTAKKDGTSAGDAPPVKVSFTQTALAGGLYYWSTTISGIYRFDFEKPGKPEAFYSATDGVKDMPHTHDGGTPGCVGCHALSRDGAKIAIGIGGGHIADIVTLDVGTKKTTFNSLTVSPSAGFSNYEAWTKDGARYVAAAFGKMRTIDAATGSKLADVATSVSMPTLPALSPDDSRLVFVKAAPFTNDAYLDGTSIMVVGFDGTKEVGAPTEIVAAASGQGSYYPDVSPDGAWVVFNRSNDGKNSYDNASAKLMLVPIGGGAAVDLANANGSGALTNSWPRFSPFTGKMGSKTLLWVTFSSKRAYGLRVAPGRPQLWIAGIVVDPSKPVGDASFAPAWLPLQDPSTSNHIAQWAKKIIAVK